MIRGLALWLLEKALFGVVYVLAGTIGVVIGLLSCLPMLAVSSVGGLAYVVDLLSHTGLRAHERLHSMAARASGAPVTGSGWRDVEGSGHDAYSVKADISTVPQAVVTAYAPLLLALVAVASFSLARVFDSLLLLVLLVPFVLASVRYSLPSDSDSRVVLSHVRSDPLHPFNLFAVPVSLTFFLLGLPRQYHYRLLHLSEFAWGLLLFFASRPVAHFFASFTRGSHWVTVGERLFASLPYLAEIGI